MIVLPGAGVISPEVAEAGEVCVPERRVSDVVEPVSKGRLDGEAAADADCKGEAIGDDGAARDDTTELSTIGLTRQVGFTRQ